MIERGEAPKPRILQKNVLRSFWTDKKSKKVQVQVYHSITHLKFTIMDLYVAA